MPKDLADEIAERLIRSAELFIPYLDKSYEVTQERENDNVARVTWMLALLGFLVLNVSSILGPDFSMPVWGFLLWLVTALAGVCAHWAHRQVDICLMSCHSVKREKLLSFVVNGPRSATFEGLQPLLVGTDPAIAAAGKKLSKASELASQLERATFVLFTATLALYGWYAIAPAIALPPALTLLSPPSPMPTPIP